MALIESDLVSVLAVEIVVEAVAPATGAPSFVSLTVAVPVAGAVNVMVALTL
jgi:hypothetical protein